MTWILVLIIFFGVGIGIGIIFLIRSFVAPKKISTLAQMVKDGKTAAATRAAKTIISKDPRNGDAHYLLGKAYLEESKHELALMEFKTVNQIGNFGGICKEGEFRKLIADLFTRFHQEEEALKEYLLLIKLEPYEAKHYFQAGCLFEERNRGDKAVGYYKKTLELDPRHSESHFKLGLILYRNQRAQDAKASFQEALKYNGSNYQAHFYIGRILKEKQDYTGALASFEQSQKDPDLKVKSLIERGICFISTESFERASAELERAVKLSTDDKESETLYARYFLSQCYEKMRKFDAAIEQWEKIYTQKPNFKDVAEKLSAYQDLRVDDQMKDYLTASNQHFFDLCKKVIVQMGLSAQDLKEIPNGAQLIAIEGDSSKWRNTRKQPKLVWFLRTPDMIEESIVRDIHEKMKELNTTRAILFSSSNFSRMASNFAETRPIDLMNKDKLQNYLKQTS